MQRQSSRRSVPLWHIAPLCLVPPVIVAALTYYVELSPELILYTLALSCTALLLIAAPHKQVRWLLVVAAVMLGIVLAAGGGNAAGLTAVVAKWAHIGHIAG